MYTSGAPASATATAASRAVPITVNGAGVATAAEAFPLLLTPIVMGARAEVLSTAVCQAPGPAATAGPP